MKTQKNTRTFLTPAASALLTAALAAVAMGQEALLNTNLNRHPVTPPVVQTAVVAGTQFVPYLDQVPAGTTLRINPNTGRLEPGKVAFVLNPASSGNNTTSMMIDCRKSVNGSRDVSRIDMESSISYSTFVTEVAVDYAQSLESNSEQSAMTIEWLYRSSFQDEIVPANLPLSAFTPEAQQILSIADPVLRTQAWRAAGFGDYIVCGRRPVGEVSLKFSADASTSQQARESLLDVYATYGNITVEGTLGRVFSKLSNQSTLNWSLRGRGIDTSALGSLPSLSTNPTPSELLAFDTFFKNAAATARTSGGAIVMDAGALNFGPVTSLPSFGHQYFDNAMDEVKACLDLMDGVRPYRNSSAMYAFLDRIPSSGPLLESYAETLDHQLQTLGDKLSDMDAAVRYYLADNHSNLPTTQTMFTQASNALQSARLALAQTITALSMDIENPAIVPQMVVSSTYSWTWQNHAYSHNPASFVITIHNAALFPRQPLNDLLGYGSVLQYITGPNSATDDTNPNSGWKAWPLTIYETNYAWQSWQHQNFALNEGPANQAQDNHFQLSNWTLESLSRNPATGLYDLTIRVNANLQWQSSFVDIRFIDDLGRPGNHHQTL